MTKYAKQEEWSEMRWSPGEPILIRGDIYFRYHDEQLRIVEIKRVKGDTVTYRVWGSKAD